MSEQPIVQVSTPIRQGELPQVVVRADDVPDLLTAEQVLDRLKDNVLAAMGGVVSALREIPISTEQAMNNLATAGLNPVVMSHQAPPVEVAYAPPVPQAAPVTQCAACPPGRDSTKCPACGAPTRHTVKGGANKYNAHVCTVEPSTKGHLVWCQTPIKNALRNAVGNNPELIYG